MAGKLISRILWVLFVGAAFLSGLEGLREEEKLRAPCGDRLQQRPDRGNPGGRVGEGARTNRQDPRPEGDLVQPEQVVARMDIATLEAQLAKAKANQATTEEKASWCSSRASFAAKASSGWPRASMLA